MNILINKIKQQYVKDVFEILNIKEKIISKFGKLLYVIYYNKLNCLAFLILSIITFIVLIYLPYVWMLGVEKLTGFDIAIIAQKLQYAGLQLGEINQLIADFLQKPLSSALFQSVPEENVMYYIQENVHRLELQKQILENSIDNLRIKHNLLLQNQHNIMLNKQAYSNGVMANPIVAIFIFSLSIGFVYYFGDINLIKNVTS